MQLTFPFCNSFFCVSEGSKIKRPPVRWDGRRLVVHSRATVQDVENFLRQHTTESWIPFAVIDAEKYLGREFLFTVFPRSTINLYRRIDDHFRKNPLAVGVPVVVLGLLSKLPSDLQTYYLKRISNGWTPDLDELRKEVVRLKVSRRERLEQAHSFSSSRTQLERWWGAVGGNVNMWSDSIKTFTISELLSFRKLIDSIIEEIERKI